MLSGCKVKHAAGRAVGFCALLTLSLGIGCGGGSVSPQTASSPAASAGGASNGGSGATAPSGSSGGSGSATPASAPAASGFLYIGLDDSYSYYGNIPHTGHAAIAGFSVGADGSLQSTPGSPYAGPAAALASNATASAVYAASGSTLNVNRINADGSLTVTSTLTAQALSPSIGIYESLSFDASTQMLYAVANHGSGTEFFEIYKTGSDGSLNNNGNQQGTVSTYPLSFTADGKRAYEPYCYHLDSEIFALTIGSDGKLTSSNANAKIPTVDAQYPSCPHVLALSPDDKFVAAPLNSVTTAASALGVWSTNPDGTLTAVAGSPYPRTAPASDIAWDVSGRYIAVAAKDGLWIYSFVAGSAPTPIGGAAIVPGPIDHVAFNKSGTLLMATSASAQTLYVFRVNASTGALTPAAGSPHNLGVAPYELVMAER